MVEENADEKRRDSGDASLDRTLPDVDPDATLHLPLAGDCEWLSAYAWRSQEIEDASKNVFPRSYFAS